MPDLKDKSDAELKEYIIVARQKGGTVDKLLAFALEEILRLREERCTCNDASPDVLTKEPCLIHGKPAPEGGGK